MIASRRRFLQASATILASAPCIGAPERAASATASILNFNATEAVAAMRHGDLSVEQYASAILDRSAECEALNAFITLEPARVLEAARDRDRERRAGGRVGPLYGLPIPLKDSINTQDYPTTAGTAALRHFQPRKDAPLVTILRRAGALVLGKTNLHELQLGYTSDNLAFGAVHNPYDLTRIPGGSSGGSAVAVAARMATLSVAEDTEGSIRVPAALCGVAGFRPTTGRYPTQGVMPCTPLFDQLGPHARCAADLVLFDSALTGDYAPLPPRTLEGVRLGIVRSYWAELDPEVEQLSREALERLRRAGAELVESDPPELRDHEELIRRGTEPILIGDFLRNLRRYLRESGTGVTLEQLSMQASPEIQRILRGSSAAQSAVIEVAYRAARDRYLPSLRQRFRRYFAASSVAAIVFPPTPVAAPPIGANRIRVGDSDMALERAMSRNIAPGSTVGLPALVLPVGLTAAGLPIALEFDGPHATDRKLLRLAIALERALGRIAPPPIARHPN